jgi:uncharacterized protein YaiI (UPF0178 family)
MRIGVDADGCPAVVRDIAVRAAQRTDMELTLVAKLPIRVPAATKLRTLQVPSGLDAADHEIVRRIEAGDLVVTADIPLAAEVVAAGALALNPRAELYTAENVRDCLNLRDFMDTLRSSGVPPALRRH